MILGSYVFSSLLSPSPGSQEAQYAVEVPEKYLCLRYCRAAASGGYYSKSNQPRVWVSIRQFHLFRRAHNTQKKEKHMEEINKWGT